MKRIISVFLVALMCLGMMTTFASAGEYHEFAVEDLKPQWPIKTGGPYTITGIDYYRTYKPTKHPNGEHNGIDVSVKGVEIYPVYEGTVEFANWNGDAGQMVELKHEVNGKTYYSRYLHLAKIKVKEGQLVDEDTILGISGNTGSEGTGYHLHFDITKDGKKNYKDRGYTFDYYINNQSALENVRFLSGWTNSNGAKRSVYWDWIVKNSQRVNGDYVLNTHTHNYKDDVANEKCNCGATMVRQYEDAHGEYTVIKKTSIKSKPYASYGERQIRLKVGDKVTVKRKFKNVYGNTWCEVSFGKYSGYAYLGDLKKVEAQNVESTLNINVTQYPTTINQGESFGLRGEVTSNYTISSVKGYIINSSGDTVQSTTDTPKSKKMDIRPASLNQNLLFNKLSSGKYTLKIVAKDSSGKSKTWDEVFVVKGEEATAEPSSPAPAYTPALPSYTEPVVAPLATTHKEEKPAVVHSSISIILDTFPKGNLPYGKPFTLSGKFTSDCAIVEARAYMLDANKNVIMEAKGSSTTSNYYIKGYALDNGMKFNKLSPGGYYLKYYVKDANGDTATWVSDKFYIVK